LDDMQAGYTKLRKSVEQKDRQIKELNSQIFDLTRGDVEAAAQASLKRSNEENRNLQEELNKNDDTIRTLRLQLERLATPVMQSSFVPSSESMDSTIKEQKQIIETKEALIVKQNTELENLRKQLSAADKQPTKQEIDDFRTLIDNNKKYVETLSKMFIRTDEKKNQGRQRNSHKRTVLLTGPKTSAVGMSDAPEEDPVNTPSSRGLGGGGGIAAAGPLPSAVSGGGGGAPDVKHSIGSGAGGGVNVPALLIQSGGAGNVPVVPIPGGSAGGSGGAAGQAVPLVNPNPNPFGYAEMYRNMAMGMHAIHDEAKRIIKSQDVDEGPVGMPKSNETDVQVQLALARNEFKIMNSQLNQVQEAYEQWFKETRGAPPLFVNVIAEIQRQMMATTTKMTDDDDDEKKTKRGGGGGGNVGSSGGGGTSTSSSILMQAEIGGAGGAVAKVPNMFPNIPPAAGITPTPPPPPTGTSGGSTAPLPSSKISIDEKDRQIRSGFEGFRQRLNNVYAGLNVASQPYIHEGAVLSRTRQRMEDKTVFDIVGEIRESYQKATDAIRETFLKTMTEKVNCDSERAALQESVKHYEKIIQRYKDWNDVVQNDLKIGGGGGGGVPLTPRVDFKMDIEKERNEIKKLAVSGLTPSNIESSTARTLVQQLEAKTELKLAKLQSQNDSLKEKERLNDVKIKAAEKKFDDKEKEFVKLSKDNKKTEDRLKAMTGYALSMKVMCKQGDEWKDDWKRRRDAAKHEREKFEKLAELFKNDVKAPIPPAAAGSAPLPVAASAAAPPLPTPSAPPLTPASSLDLKYPQPPQPVIGSGSAGVLGPTPVVVGSAAPPPPPPEPFDEKVFDEFDRYMKEWEASRQGDIKAPRDSLDSLLDQLTV